MMDIDTELVEQAGHPPCCQQVGVVGSAGGEPDKQTILLGCGFFALCCKKAAWYCQTETMSIGCCVVSVN